MAAAMREICIPQLRLAEGPSVALQCAQVDGATLCAVSVWDRSGRRWHRWHASETDALAYAVEQADALALLLLDLRDPGGTE